MHGLPSHRRTGPHRTGRPRTGRPRTGQPRTGRWSPARRPAARVVLVGVAALASGAVLTGCGLRVDMPQQSAAAPRATAAPGGSAGTAAPATAPATAGAPAGSASTAPATTAPASASTAPLTTAAPTTASPSTTTAAPTTAGTPAFDKAAFCADVAAAPIKDITGFATVDKAKATALRDLFDRIEDTAPAELKDVAVRLNGPVQELTAAVLSGEITTVAQLQERITGLGPERLAAWIQAQRDTIAWADGNC